MPAMHYTLRWPDASESRCYSPSLVIQDHLAVGETYPLDDLLQRLRQATATAHQRVQAKYGFPCSRAAAQLDLIEQRAAGFASQPGALVTVLAFGPADA